MSWEEQRKCMLMEEVYHPRDRRRKKRMINMGLKAGLKGLGTCETLT